MVVRHWLWRRGFRYSLNQKRLPGHPDIVLRKWKACIFVNGCFWHGHMCSLTPAPSPKGEGSEYLLSGSSCCKIPKTNREFWVSKIRRNMERDGAVRAQLEAKGWRCFTVWECELKPSQREVTLERLERSIRRPSKSPLKGDFLSGTQKDDGSGVTYPMPEEAVRKVADESFD